MYTRERKEQRKVQSISVFDRKVLKKNGVLEKKKGKKERKNHTIKHIA